jgi:hypothetical protein
MQFQDSKKEGEKQTLSPTLRLPKECKETGNRVVKKELRLNSNLAQIRNCKSWQRARKGVENNLMLPSICKSAPSYRSPPSPQQQVRVRNRWTRNESGDMRCFIPTFLGGPHAHRTRWTTGWSPSPDDMMGHPSLATLTDKTYSSNLLGQVKGIKFC